MYYMYMSSYAYSARYSKRPHYSYVQLQFTAHEYDNASAFRSVFESEYVYVANLNSNSNSTSIRVIGGDWWPFKQLRRNLCYTICAMTTNTHEVFRFAKLFLWRRRQRFLIRFSAIAEISPHSLYLFLSQLAFEVNSNSLRTLYWRTSIRYNRIWPSETPSTTTTHMFKCIMYDSLCVCVCVPHSTSWLICWKYIFKCESILATNITSSPSGLVVCSSRLQIATTLVLVNPKISTSRLSLLHPCTQLLQPVLP